MNNLPQGEIDIIDHWLKVLYPKRGDAPIYDMYVESLPNYNPLDKSIYQSEVVQIGWRLINNDLAEYVTTGNFWYIKFTPLGKEVAEAGGVRQYLEKQRKKQEEEQAEKDRRAQLDELDRQVKLKALESPIPLKPEPYLKRNSYVFTIVGCIIATSALIISLLYDRCGVIKPPKPTITSSPIDTNNPAQIGPPVKSLDSTEIDNLVGKLDSGKQK